MKPKLSRTGEQHRTRVLADMRKHGLADEAALAAVGEAIAALWCAETEAEEAAARRLADEVVERYGLAAES